VAIEMEFSSRVESYVATITRLRQSNRRFAAYLSDRDLNGEDDLSEILRKPALRSFLYAALLKVSFPSSRCLSLLITVT
jgi:hypothetical protein